MKYYFKTKINNYFFTIVEEDNFITYITLDDLEIDGLNKKTALIAKTKVELEEYFKGFRTRFDIPIKLNGTKFQNMVWQEMLNIPYGRVLSYGELAKKVDNPKAVRAIGSVCHNNKILIIVPCHRVVAKNSIGGFGCGVEMKIKLLELEKK
ncbi:MAG: methylated-DNA--[protein]-cysteine S-methyltransferase [Bacilli bacterium]|jgi:methylated-DNA-[protein]-cysteine S-methyltransferase|nr:methylated-DNA--[protein]-cysteine S-methyltransferase [Bacilli bacterium]